MSEVSKEMKYKLHVLLYVAAIHTVAAGHKMISDGWIMAGSDMFRGGNRGVATTPKITEADDNPHFNPYPYSNPNNTSKGGARGGQRRRNNG